MQEHQNYTLQVDEEIDIMELVSKLWKKRIMIIKWSVVGAIFGLIIGFSIPKTYTASVSFAPETQQRTTSNVSSIASMMGVNLNNSADAISVDMYPDIVHSTPFILDLFDLPVTFTYKDRNITSTLLDYMKDYQKVPWWRHIFSAPSKCLHWLMSIGKEKNEKYEISVNELKVNNLPYAERVIVAYFAENILVNVDKKKGKTTISLDLQDPLVVATVMEAITENLKNYMSDYRTSKARQDIENLEVICEQRKSEYYLAQQKYALHVDGNKNIARQSAQAEHERLQQEMNLAYQVYSQVATQLEAARILEQQSKPVFVIIDPITIPINRTAPSKSKLLVIFMFISACCAITWILFGEDYWKKLQEKL